MWRMILDSGVNRKKSDTIFYMHMKNLLRTKYFLLLKQVYSEDTSKICFRKFYKTWNNSFVSLGMHKFVQQDIFFKNMRHS